MLRAPWWAITMLGSFIPCFSECGVPNANFVQALIDRSIPFELKPLIYELMKNDVVERKGINDFVGVSALRSPKDSSR